MQFGPWALIDGNSVAPLVLAWIIDLPVRNPVSEPIELDFILYTSTGYSVVSAVNATMAGYCGRSIPQPQKRLARNFA